MEEATSQDTIKLDLFIRRSPESVKKWWTDFADDYTAKDPSEQPYRIVTTKKVEDTANGGGGRELVCYWRSPDGSERKTQETMYLFDNDLSAWAFDVVHPAGLNIRDEFRAFPVEGGTRLEIRSRISPNKSGAEAIIPTQRERMIQHWKNMVEICERDAP